MPVANQRVNSPPAPLPVWSRSWAMRRRGVASSALPLLFAAMKARGFAVCVVQIAPDNAASLALHRRLGFAETGRSAAAVTMEKML